MAFCRTLQANIQSSPSPCSFCARSTRVCAACASNFTRGCSHLAFLGGKGAAVVDQCSLWSFWRRWLTMRLGSLDKQQRFELSLFLPRFGRTCGLRVALSLPHQSSSLTTVAVSRRQNEAMTPPVPSTAAKQRNLFPTFKNNCGWELKVS